MIIHKIVGRIENDEYISERKRTFYLFRWCNLIGQKLDIHKMKKNKPTECLSCKQNQPLSSSLLHFSKTSLFLNHFLLCVMLTRLPSYRQYCICHSWPNIYEDFFFSFIIYSFALTWDYNSTNWFCPRNNLDMMVKT